MHSFLSALEGFIIIENNLKHYNAKLPSRQRVKKETIFNLLMCKVVPVQIN